MDCGRECREVEAVTLFTMSGAPSCSPPVDESRRLFARHLAGIGVELGPGHQPFPAEHPGTKVRYVDRWGPEDQRRLFPEIADAIGFVEPEFVCNLDTDRLSPLADESQDFVIASHVLEHVAEPLGLLIDIWRVLRPGGVALLMLPDRRRTFDREREPTPLEHLVREHEAGVTDVDEEHILDFLVKTNTPFQAEPPEARAEEFQRARLRSIHVHCWHEEEFLEVLSYSVTATGLRWELIDATIADEHAATGFEFGFVLRKSTLDLAPAVLAERLESSWSAWREDLRAQLRVTESLRSEVEAMRAQLVELQAVTAHQERRLALLRKSPLYPAFRLVQQVRRAIAVQVQQRSG